MHAKAGIAAMVIKRQMGGTIACQGCLGHQAGPSSLQATLRNQKRTWKSGVGRALHFLAGNRALIGKPT
jgi:hypothetical protein